MRKIVQKELEVSEAGTPVIVYVSPNGARAASAGVWISQAADLLAMAPDTNIGSSTPINGTGSNIGSDLRRKIVNDAAASLRGLAPDHGRNAAWADKAVRVASNLTAAEALKMNVIDTIAPTLPALLDKVDGRTTVPRATSCTRERRDRRVEPRLPHAVPHDHPRPEPPLAALPRRDRRDRLRDLPSGRRPPRRARRGLAPARAVRARGAADRRGPASGSSCSASCSSRSTPTCRQHGALTLSGLIALGLRPRHALPRLVGPLHDLDPARGHDHGRDRRPVGLRRSRRRSPARGQPVLVGPGTSSGCRASFARAASYTSTASCGGEGRRAAPHGPACRGRRARRAHAHVHPVGSRSPR